MSKKDEITAWLRVEAGTRGPGALMPTIAEVCRRFGVAGVQTVRDGYEPLIAAGVVERLDSPRRWAVVASETHAAGDDLSGDDIEAMEARVRVAMAQAHADLASAWEAQEACQIASGEADRLAIVDSGADTLGYGYPPEGALEDAHKSVDEAEAALTGFEQAFVASALAAIRELSALAGAVGGGALRAVTV